MTDKHITVDSIRWHSVLPWLHLLRAVQLALRVRIVLLAMLGVLAFQLGFGLLSLLHGRQPGGDLSKIWKSLEMSLPFKFHAAERPDFSMAFVSLVWDMWPWATVTSPASQLFERDNSWSSIAIAWTALLFSLSIWAIFGGAMTRIVAVRFARDESVPMCAALRFSARNWQSYLYGPLLPMLAVGLFASLSGGIGWLHRWWGVEAGGVLAYLGFIPLLCGLAIAFLLLLMAVSWPLMVASISTEGSDGFDGLSRAFGYVMNRPWYFAFLVCLAHLLGTASFYAVHWFAAFTWKMVEWSSAIPRGSSFGIWNRIANCATFAVLIGFFWSATTVIYFLLRQADDGTPLDQVYMPGPAPTPEPLPLVGVAASQQPVIERPATDEESAS